MLLSEPNDNDSAAGESTVINPFNGSLLFAVFFLFYFILFLFLMFSVFDKNAMKAGYRRNHEQIRNKLISYLPIHMITRSCTNAGQDVSHISIIQYSSA